MIHLVCSYCKRKKQLNSVAWVHERTIPTERPQLVGEVSDVCESRNISNVIGYMSLLTTPQWHAVTIRGIKLSHYVHSDIQKTVTGNKKTSPLIPAISLATLKSSIRRIPYHARYCKSRKYSCFIPVSILQIHGPRLIYALHLTISARWKHLIMCGIFWKHLNR
jgi:hypothetical protein